MLIIGLTGSFGTGKTTVAKMFAARGAKVLDTDKIVHALLSKSGACAKAVVRKFGKGILSGNVINRRKLAAIVFSDRKKLKILERIVHPHVIREVQRALRRLAQGRKHKIVIIEVPLLFESGMHRNVHRTVVVTASRQAQVSRGQRRTGMKAGEIKKRITQQMPLAQKVRRADFVINNSGTITQTRKQAQELWDKFQHVVK